MNLMRSLSMITEKDEFDEESIDNSLVRIFFLVVLIIFLFVGSNKF